VKWQKRAGFLPLTDRISDETTVASGTYVDVGPIRIQYGLAPSGSTGARTITLPAPFKSTSYSVTASVGVLDASSRTVNLEPTTASTFTVRVTAGGNGSGALFNWIAIGLVP
jgi:hypothetical protein